MHPSADVLPPTPPRGWHSRGYLPHFDGGPIEQSVTYCLAGAMPRELLEAWRASVTCLREAKARAELLKRIERYLDRGVGEQLLRHAKAAAVVENALLHRNGEQYPMRAWVVMPSHAHTLFTPIAGHELSRIVQAWK